MHPQLDSFSHNRPQPMHAIAFLLLIALVPLFSTAARARPLDRRIPELFSGGDGADGEFSTTLVQGRVPRDEEVHRIRLADAFKRLGEALAIARGQMPIPSASGSFAFNWDADAETYVPVRQSLGPGFAERGRTLGKGVVALSFAYARADFDTIDGDDLDSLHRTESAVSTEFLAGLPASDRDRYADDLLDTTLDVDLRLQMFWFTAAYGLTDNIDVGLAFTVNDVHMKARAEGRILDPSSDGSVFFAINQPGVVAAREPPACPEAFLCARDQFKDSATGVGDIYLRAKWSVLRTSWGDYAVSGVLTVPTGNADDLLGFHDPTFTPWLIVSESFEWVSPYVNLGYSIRSGDDVSQAEWIVGADVPVTSWATLDGSFFGYHDDHQDGFSDNVVQSAIGLKVNPFSKAVLATTFQFPVNRDGLRADVTYGVQLEWTF